MNTIVAHSRGDGNNYLSVVPPQSARQQHRDRAALHSILLYNEHSTGH